MRQDKYHNSLNRRGFIKASLGGALGLSASKAFAAPNSMETAVAAARRLKGTESVALKLLLPEGSRANIDPIVAEFLRRTNIEVLIQEVPVDEVNLQLSLDAMSGVRDYDLALPATFSLPDLVQDGTILPLSEFVETYEDAQARSSVLFRTGDTFDDQIYGFQTDGDAYMMFYHGDMLDSQDEKQRYADKFGTALTIPVTWQDLDQQMKWFHRPEEGKFGGLLFRTKGYVAWEWWVRFHAFGTWPFAPDLTPQLQSDAGIMALEDMIRSSENLAPEAGTVGLFGNWKRYALGDVYANIGWGGSQKYFNSKASPVKGKLRYGATPGGMVNNELLITPYFNWGWNYVVTSNSKSPELAYLFALFAASPEMSTLAVGQVDGFFDPFRSEHYGDPNIKAAYSEPFLRVHAESMSNAIPDLYLARQGDYFLSLAEWVSRALNGSIKPEDAMRRAEQQWNVISNEVGLDIQAARWRALRAKYPPQAQRLLQDL